MCCVSVRRILSQIFRTEHREFLGIDLRAEPLCHHTEWQKHPQCRGCSQCLFSRILSTSNQLRVYCPWPRRPPACPAYEAGYTSRTMTSPSTRKQQQDQLWDVLQAKHYRSILIATLAVGAVAAAAALGSAWPVVRDWIV